MAAAPSPPWTSRAVSRRPSRGGQVSVPAEIRRRWGTTRLTLDDLGDRIVLIPAPEDPIAAARGALGGPGTTSTDRLRRAARETGESAEARRARR